MGIVIPCYESELVLCVSSVRRGVSYGVRFRTSIKEKHVCAVSSGMKTGDWEMVREHLSPLAKGAVVFGWNFDDHGIWTYCDSKIE